MDAERLQAERQARLRALIRLAKERSPWHGERLAHIDPDTVTEVDLASIPVMTKDAMMANLERIWTDQRLSRDLVEAHLDSLHADSYLLDEFHAVASGGSTGTRGVFVYGWDGWMLCRVTMMRFGMRHQLRHAESARTPMVGHVAAGKATHMTFAMSRTFGAGSGVVPIPATLPLRDIVTRLNELQPEILAGYPSMLDALAAEARAGRLKIKPGYLRPGSEPLLPEMRAAMEDAWGCPIINVYGTSEGASAPSCAQSPGLHLNEEPRHLRDDGRGRQARGARRARLEDVRYEPVQQRLLDAPHRGHRGTQRRPVHIRRRVVVHPLIFRSLLGRERQVIEYQVSQTQRGASIAIRTQCDVDTSSLAKALEVELLRVGLPEPSVTVEIVDGFDRQKTGKLKRFLPLS